MYSCNAGKIPHINIEDWDVILRSSNLTLKLLLDKYFFICASKPSFHVLFYIVSLEEKGNLKSNIF